MKKNVSVISFFIALVLLTGVFFGYSALAEVRSTPEISSPEVRYQLEQLKADEVQKTPEELASELLKSETYSKYDFKAWNANAEYRDIANLPYYRLLELIEFYPRQISALALGVGDSKDAELISNTEVEIARLKDKFITCSKEKEFRDAKVVDRLIHRTIYYIDLAAGNDSATGLSTAQAWRSVKQFTTNTTRTPGDLAYVRANTTETIGVADIQFDESGNVTNCIELRGCSSAVDPWGDGKDTKPVLDFNAGAFQGYLSQDYYWTFTRIDWYNSSDTHGILTVGDRCRGVRLIDCVFRGGATVGLELMQCNYVYSEGCSFYSNHTYSVYVAYTICGFKSCYFDGGALTTDYALEMYLSTAYCEDCYFGLTSKHDAAAVYFVRYLDRVSMRNCSFNTTETEQYYISDPSNIYSFLLSEDHNGVKGAQKSWYYQGTVTRNSSVQLDSLDSALMAPNSGCSFSTPLSLNPGSLDKDYQIWCDNVSTTINVTARETTAWTADPSATKFRLCSSYLNGATSGNRTISYSTQTLNSTTEIDFSVNVTPQQEGWVYVWWELSDYESGKSINVSVKPSVS